MVRVPLWEAEARRERLGEERRGLERDEAGAGAAVLVDVDEDEIRRRGRVVRP